MGYWRGPLLYRVHVMSDTAPKLAFSYIRFSSKKQELSDSLRRQTEASVRYAKNHNMVLSTESFEDLGVSAYKGLNASIEKDGGLALFLRAVDEGVIPHDAILLVESLDRISRQTIDQALELFMSILRRGITVVSLIDNQVYSKERLASDHGISLIISITTFVRAHEESLVKSQRVGAAWTNKRATQKILTKQCPGWMRVSDDYSEYILIDEKVKIVRRVFELAMTGLGTPSIAKKLNAEGVPLLSKIGSWGPENVSSILKNQAVFGRYVPSRAKNVLPIDDQYPAIIDKATFERVAEMTSTRSAGRKTVDNVVGNLWATVSFCAACGSRFRVASQSTSTDGKTLKYFCCAKSYSNKQDCSAERFPYHELETQLLDFIFSRVPTVQHKHGPIFDHAEMIKQKQIQVDRLLELVMSGMRSAQIDEKIKELTNEIEDHRKKLVSAPVASPIEQVYARSHRYYQKLLAYQKIGNDLEVQEARTKLRVEMPRLVSRLEVSRVRWTDGETIFRRIWIEGPLWDARQTFDVAHTPQGINGTRGKAAIENGKVLYLDELPELL